MRTILFTLILISFASCNNEHAKEGDLKIKSWLEKNIEDDLMAQEEFFYDSIYGENEYGEEILDTTYYKYDSKEVNPNSDEMTKKYQFPPKLSGLEVPLGHSDTNIIKYFQTDKTRNAV